MYFQATFKSNLPDCADGKGVCHLNDNGQDTSQCRDGSALLDEKGDCAQINPNAVCCPKQQPFETTMSFLNDEFYNVRVAIDPAVPNDPQLLDALKAALREASMAMYTATESRAWIRS